MKNVLTIVQIVVSLGLIVCVLLQAKGTGFGSTLISPEHYSTKRGLEKTVFIATIVLLVVFAALSILQLVVVS